MKRNELLRERALPILAEFNSAVLDLFEGNVDEHVTAALAVAFAHVSAAFSPASDDSPPPIKRKRRKPKGSVVQRDEAAAPVEIVHRDPKPDNAVRRRSSPTCGKCGTLGHNARGCRGGKGGGVELGEVERSGPDHDRRELIAAHQARIAAERAEKERVKRDAWLEGAAA